MTVWAVLPQFKPPNGGARSGADLPGVTRQGRCGAGANPAFQVGRFCAAPCRSRHRKLVHPVLADEGQRYRRVGWVDLTSQAVPALGDQYDGVCGRFHRALSRNDAIVERRGWQPGRVDGMEPGHEDRLRVPSSAQ